MERRVGDDTVELKLVPPGLQRPEHLMSGASEIGERERLPPMMQNHRPLEHVLELVPLQVRGVSGHVLGEVRNTRLKSLLDLEVAAEPEGDLAEELVGIDHRRVSGF